jgi:hypothetical protein
MKNSDLLLVLYALGGILNIILFQWIDGFHMYTPIATAFYYVAGLVSGLWLSSLEDRSK